MSRLSLYLLGPPRIERDGVPLQIHRRRVVALLAYLAVTERAHGRDTLATLFYPEHDQRQARAGLRRTLSTLRVALGEGWLESDQETVRLRHSPGPRAEGQAGPALWLDVAAFQALLAQCRSYGHPDLPLLQQAVALYRDDFMAGFTLRDSPGFDDWQSYQTRSLRDQLAGALERLAYGYGGQGEIARAIPYARRWVALDPLHEPAHRCLMQLYARSGRRAAALRQYVECEQALRDELGVPPQEETVQLYRAILEERDVPLTGAPVAPATGLAAASRHVLPAQLTPFVGRQALLAEIVTRLQDPACRLLTLVGPGGSGKTRLAQEAGRAQVERYAGGVYWIPLATLGSTQAVVSTVASALGLTLHEGSDPRQQVLNALRQRRLLLILDNVEHLVAGQSQESVVDWVTEVLTVAPQVQILATSRERLNVEYEHLLPITGLEYPHTVSAPSSVREVERYSAVQLFVQSARRAQPGFTLTPGNRADVIRICRLVRGLPLGVLLAAAWVEMLAPADIVRELEGTVARELEGTVARELEGTVAREVEGTVAREIDTSLDFLAADLRDLPPRQRSMRAVYDHSWRLLAAREREVFAALSVFGGSLTREAARQVTGASLRELMALVHKSLLHRLPAGRFEMHDLLRRYAAGRLAETPDVRTSLRDRYCAYYVAALSAWAMALQSTGRQAALAEMDLEIDDARAAWDWAVERGYWEQVERAVDGLGHFYMQRARYEEGEAACRATAEKLAETTAGGVLGARIWTWIGDFRQISGRYDQALESYARACDMLQAQGGQSRATRERWAGLCRKIASVYEKKSDYASALDRLHEGLAILGDEETLERALIHLAQAGIDHRQGDNAQALHGCQQSVGVIRRLGSESGAGLRALAHAYYLQGAIYGRYGDWARASDLCRESLASYEQLGDPLGAASAHNNLANACAQQGDWAQAIDHYESALEIRTQAGDKYECGLISNNLGQVYLDRGDLDQAEQYYRHSLEIWQELGSGYGIAFLHNSLSAVALRRGDPDQALRLLSESVDLFHKVGSDDLLPEVYRHMAEAHLARAEPDIALEHARRSLAQAQSQGVRQEEGDARRVLGQVHLACGDRAQAERELQASLEILEDLGNRLQIGQTLVQLALLLGEQERPAEADVCLARAVDLFRTLGAQLDLAQAQSLRRPLPVSASK